MYVHVIGQGNNTPLFPRIRLCLVSVSVTTGVESILQNLASARGGGNRSRYTRCKTAEEVLLPAALAAHTNRGTHLTLGNASWVGSVKPCLLRPGLFLLIN